MSEHELSTRERRALDAWPPLGPPAGFADRVLSARDVPAPRRRWPVVAAGLAGCIAAGAVAIVMTRAPSQAAAGELLATTRTTASTASIGRRGTAVAEPDAALRWHVADDGAASIDQTSGDVFYRVERGGPFVVHTPAGDVRVLGTCFRIEVTPMNKERVVMSGAIGAALAATIIITVYEGRVVADANGIRTELSAGLRALIGADGKATFAPFDEPVTIRSSDTETYEEARARAVEAKVRLDQLIRRAEELRARRRPRNDPAEPGRTWYDPSPERLKAWAADCHVRVDSPGLDQFQPFDAAAAEKLDLEPTEIGVVNATMAELSTRWGRFVRALYVEDTGDVTGAEALTVEAMAFKIRKKGGSDERALALQRISAERAGLARPPADLSKRTPYERLMRVQAEHGNDAERALANKLGPERAKALRGDGFPERRDWAGCPTTEPVGVPPMSAHRNETGSDGA